MIEFDDWRGEAHVARGRDWVILGKGPTFARRDDFPLDDFVTISLNHVVKEMRVDIAHMIDFDVAEACAEAIRDNATWLLMPRHPHIAHRPSLQPLSELIAFVPALKTLDAEGRIVCYDLRNSPKPPVGTVIDGRYFSSEAALDLAGHLGARRVRTLGVDGGTAYSQDFAALSSSTRLANGQPSFSIQFQQLDQISKRHGLDFEPMVPALRIFVGAQEREIIPARVLEFTINEHATVPVRVTQLPAVTRTPRDPSKRQRTPFSFSRFLIPELCGFQGRALYLDSDMHVFDDVSKLWDIPFDGAKVMCTNQTWIPPQWKNNPGFHPGRQMSVMMLDAAALPWKIDDIIDAMDRDELTYEQLMFEMALVPSDEVTDALPTGWNHLEHYVDGETKLLHYTAIPTQPWTSEDNPLRKLWEGAFVRACQAGYIDAELVERHIRAGYVRPSLRRLVPSTARARPVYDSPLAAELGATRAELDRHVARQLSHRAEAAARAVYGEVARAVPGARAWKERLARAARRRLPKL